MIVKTPFVKMNREQTKKNILVINGINIMQNTMQMRNVFFNRCFKANK